MRSRAVGLLLTLVLALPIGLSAPAWAQEETECDKNLSPKECECDKSVPLDECLLEAVVVRAILDVEAYKAEVFRLLNERRKDKGLSELTRVEPLERAAQGHSEAMRDFSAGRAPYYSHEDPITFSMPNGPNGRIVGAGYTNAVVTNEIVADGQTSPWRVVDRWMNSTTGHREEILNPSYQDVGLGLAEGPTAGIPSHLWWTVTFGRSTVRHNGIQTTYSPVQDAHELTQTLLRLLRLAEQAYCLGDKASFEKYFREFVDLWVSIGLSGTYRDLTGQVGECLDHWLVGPKPDDSSYLRKAWRLD